MPCQDHNAANAGDLLKHALLTEVLARLDPGENWGYAETHAGAGQYPVLNAHPVLAAAPVHQELSRPVSASPEGAAAQAPPGRAFATALCRWWSQPSMMLFYPGSPVLALLTGAVAGAVVLTEAEPGSAQRLRRALTEASDRVRQASDALSRLRGASGADPAAERWASAVHQGSFEDHLQALLAPSPLCLMVDPFYYLREAPDGHGGRIGEIHLRRFVAGLRGRDAILCLFASRLPAGLGGKESGGGHPGIPGPPEFPGISGRRRTSGSPGASGVPGTWRSLRADLAALDPDGVRRCYRAGGTPHGVVLAGWGRGASAVLGLPGADAWKRSWLAQPPVGLRFEELPG